MPLTLIQKYPMPDFLKGRCSESDYIKWLRNKADTLLKRDKKRNKPYARNAGKAAYKAYIHQAVLTAGNFDPYTGEPMQWELIGTWDPAAAREGSDTYKKQFAMMPTVDHKDCQSDLLQFEICTWQINDCKCDLTPTDFIKMCRKVTRYHHH
jgi:hypothetical protein